MTSSAITSSAEVLSELSVRGWLLLRSEGEDSHLRVSNSIGKIIPSVKGGPLVDTLLTVPSEQAKPRSLSSLYGLRAFPFHTDSANHPIPPRYIVLSYRSLEKSSRATLLVDTSAFNISGSDIKSLRREPWFVNGGRGRFFTPIMSDTCVPSCLVFRFDERVMRPALSSSDSGSILKKQVASTTSIRIEWEPNFVLVLDNWRMLHAREGGNAPDQPRVLLRSLVEGTA
jgi:alpha-ketoglutarate-dependent taurine dioxygenase